jgi:hypothetical protein
MAAKVAEKTKTPSVRELRKQISNLARQLSPERLRMAVGVHGVPEGAGGMGSHLGHPDRPKDDGDD